jgi:hypothetical protein
MLASSHSRMYCLSWALLIWSHSDDMVHIYLRAKKKMVKELLYSWNNM